MIWRILIAPFSNTSRVMTTHCQTVLLLLFAWFLVPSLALAKSSSSLTLGVSPIPQLIGEEPSEYGPYNRVLAEFTDAKFELIFSPPARAERLFGKKQLDCLFPASVATMPDKSQLLQSEAIDKVKAYLFTREPYRQFRELHRISIALRRGFTYGNVKRWFPAYYVELGSDVLTLQFLHLKRVDAVVGYLPDIRSASLILAKPMPFFDVEQPVYAAADAIVCHQTPEARELIQSIDKKIVEMRRTGQLRKLLDKQ